MLNQSLKNTCHPLIEGVGTEYGYRPSLAAGIVFCLIFGLSMVAHTYQFITSRKWWCSLFTIGCFVEVLGWAARAWSWHCPYMSNAFLMQISTLILAPTFFTAGIYVILGEYIRIVGRESSFLKPSLYLWIFCTCDVISLVTQAIGGGMASKASNQTNGNTKPGTDVMVAGILFQLASITVFVFFALDFLNRTRRPQLIAKFTPKMRILLVVTCFSITCIYARSIYRAIELLQGWKGYLITHQWFFIGLDGIPMSLAVVVFNFFHPSYFMPPVPYGGKEEEREGSPVPVETVADVEKNAAQTA